VTIGALRYAGRRLAATPGAVGAMAVLAVAGWQGLTVHLNYQAEWTALFCVGGSRPLPPELDNRTYRFAGSTGYDGQFYRLVAHDPWLTRGYSKYADDAAFRWRRILVPGVVWALAGGARERIDGTYVVVVLLFTGLGAYALSCWLLRRGRHPAGGLLFPLLPGTLISIDRMTVDVALYCLLFLCLIWDEERQTVRLWLGLALCGLVRDLGFLVIGAFFLAEAAAFRFRRAAWMLAAALPGAAWYAWLRFLLSTASSQPLAPEVPQWIFYEPGYGILLRMLNPVHYDLSRGKAILAVALDEVALAGLVAGLLLSVVLFRPRKAGKLEWVGLAFAALFVAVSSDWFWRDPFSWPRAFTPMLASLVFSGRQTARRWVWMPLAAVTLRVGLQFGTQVEGILRAIR